MSDVLFIFPTDGAEYHLGIATISAFIKRDGVSVELFMIDFRRPQALIDSELVRTVETEKPLLIAVSVMSPYWIKLNQWLHRLKEMTDAPILIGGWHPTLVPEKTLQHPCVDYICLGEGELATLELIQAIKRGDDSTSIQNIWTIYDDEIIKNPLRSPIPDLDILPPPDYELFNYAKVMKRKSMQALGEAGPSDTACYMFGRGCAYRCTYCNNHAYQQCYGLPAKYFIRRRSLSVVMKDLKDIVTKYHPKRFELWDEDITLDKEWFRKFTVEYPRHIGLPFSTLIRPNNAQGNQLEMLANAGCKLVMMGIECGNEAYRKKYLRRNITNKQIFRAFELARKNGIMTLSFNILGLPFETEQHIRETITINRQIQPDYFLVFKYNPFEGTELFRMATEAGVLKNTQITGYGHDGIGGANVNGIDDATFNSLYNQALDLQQVLNEKRKQRYPDEMNCN